MSSTSQYMLTYLLHVSIIYMQDIEQLEHQLNIPPQALELVSKKHLLKFFQLFLMILNYPLVIMNLFLNLFFCHKQILGLRFKQHHEIPLNCNYMKAQLLLFYKGINLSLVLDSLTLSVSLRDHNQNCRLKISILFSLTYFLDKNIFYYFYLNYQSFQSNYDNLGTIIVDCPRDYLNNHHLYDELLMVCYL